MFLVSTFAFAFVLSLNLCFAAAQTSTPAPRPARGSIVAAADYDLDQFLIPSLFAHIPPFIRFSTSETPVGWRLPPQLQQLINVSAVKGSSPKHTLILHFVMNRTGFVESSTDDPATSEVNLPPHSTGRHEPPFAILDTRPLNSAILRGYQKVNAFPGVGELGIKDRQCRNLKRFMRKFGATSGENGNGSGGFVLPCFVVPDEGATFRKEWRRRERDSAAEKLKELWIVKPANASKGRGIKLINHYSQLRRAGAPSAISIAPAVVQLYVTDPFLVNGKKIEVRTLVLLTSVDPLRAYISYDHFTLISLRNFTSASESASDGCAHVANRKSCRVRTGLDEAEVASNMFAHTPAFFAAHFSPEQEAHVKAQMEVAVVETLLSARIKLKSAARPILLNRYNGWKLLAFDFFVTRTYHVWLNEVNTAPDIGSIYWVPMLADAVTLAGFHLPPTLSPETKRLVRRFLPKGAKTEKVTFDSRLYKFANRNTRQIQAVKMAEIRRKLEMAGKQGNATSPDVQSYAGAMLANLSVDDVRQLMIAEDELARMSSRYTRLLPAPPLNTPVGREFMKFFSASNDHTYYYWLHSAWEFKYGRQGGNRSAGIERLRRLTGIVSPRIFHKYSLRTTF